MSQPFANLRKDGASSCRRTCACGFTLIELMVTLAVLVIVTLVALPSYRTFSQNSRRTAASNDFVVALNYARAQAMAQHASVAICRSSNATGTSPSCDSGSAGTGWESGWMIFVNAASDGTYNSTNDTLLRQHEALNTGSSSSPTITLRGGSSGGNATKDVIVFSRYGMPNNSGALAICDSRGWGTDARVIQLSSAGRAQAVLTTQQAVATSISSCTP